MLMCHMIADTYDELVTMARSIGVRAKWIQHKGHWSEHFDICKSKRACAVRLGAIELSNRDMGIKLHEKSGTHPARIAAMRRMR